MEILINNYSLDKWNDIVKTTANSSPFQTHDYYKFFNTVNNFSADVFAVELDEEYQALMVVTIQQEKGIAANFSRRGIVYGGPIYSDVNALEALLMEVKKHYKRKLIYIETRNYFDYSNSRDTFKKIGFEYIPWLNFHLNSSDFEAMKKKVSSSRMRQIKKAIKCGVVWKEAESLKEVQQFYHILSDLYIKKIKKPLLPKEFFEDFYKHGVGKYLLVMFEDNVIGGIMCPILPNKVIYEFYIAGLDTEFKNQYPSVMATWAAMEYATQNTIPLFDFMGAGSPDEDYGVRDFKARFGGVQVEHGRYRLIVSKLKFRIGVLGLKFLSMLKK